MRPAAACARPRAGRARSRGRVAGISWSVPCLHRTPSAARVDLPHSPVRPPLRSVKWCFPRTPVPVSRRRADSRRRGRARSTQARCSDACRTCDPRELLNLTRTAPVSSPQHEALPLHPASVARDAPPRALSIRCASAHRSWPGSARASRTGRPVRRRHGAVCVRRRPRGRFRCRCARAGRRTRGRPRQVETPGMRARAAGAVAEHRRGRIANAYTSLVRRPEGRASTRSITGAPPASAGCDVSCEATASAGAVDVSGCATIGWSAVKSSSPGAARVPGSHSDTSTMSCVKMAVEPLCITGLRGECGPCCDQTHGNAPRITGGSREIRVADDAARNQARPTLKSVGEWKY